MTKRWIMQLKNDLVRLNRERKKLRKSIDDDINKLRQMERRVDLLVDKALATEDEKDLV